MWKFLNSRRVAVYLLLGLIVLLTASAFLPSLYTLSPGQLHDLSQGSPAYYWLISHCSTPALVESPLFSLVSLLLFLSTLVCTCDRLRIRARSRNSEFAKEKAFSFSVSATSPLAESALAQAIEQELAGGKWQRSVQSLPAATVISGEKGDSGFWGSIIFHIGLLLCFLAGPLTTLTSYRSELAVLENESVPLRNSTGPAKNPLPDIEVTAHDLKARFFQGTFREEFGGVLTVGKGNDKRDLPFAVNQPIDYGGFQLSLQEFGYAPRLVIERDGRPLVDNFLKVSASEDKDRFEIGSGLTALVLFFPDFFREGDRIGSRSLAAKNPVTMVKLFRGGQLVFKGLFKPGDGEIWEGNKISVPEYRQWMSLSVAREWGILLVFAGSLLGVLGLFIRFFSNERRIEFQVTAQGEGSRFGLRGYSRFYPAFLEKEVLALAAKLGELEGSSASFQDGHSRSDSDRESSL